jgi:putative aldouronate transport system substrate-binding protein
VNNTLISQGTIIDNVGGDYFGVLLDPVNSLKVENLYTSDAFKAACEQVRNWYLKGYISKDSITNDTANPAKIKSGSYMAMMAQAKPGYSTQISGECGRPMIVFQVQSDIMKSGAVTGILWHLNQGCKDPVAVMQVLDAFYTDPILSNLIIWGEEGVDYVQTSDGHITFPEGVNADNAEWYHTMNWMLPNQYIAHIWESDPLDLWARMEAFNDNAMKSKALGFTFDNSEYSSEFSALTNVYDEYSKQLMYGFIDPETGIAEMEAKLEAAGLETYIAAKQEALDAWAKANGVE